MKLYSLISSKTNYFPLTNNLSKTNSKIFFIIRELTGIILLLYGRQYYIKSLKGCDGDEFKCIVIKIRFIFDDIRYCFKSILYFILFLVFIHLKIYSKYQIIIFIIIIFEIVLKDRGDSFLHHGFFNILSLFTFLILGEIFIILFIIIINIKKKKYLIFITINLILLYCFIHINNKEKYFCKNWDRGLNNSIISNNKTLYPCTIAIPKRKCLIDIFSPLLDLSKILNIKCENRKEKEKYLLKSFSNLKSYPFINKIAYPTTKIDKEEINDYTPLHGGNLMNYIMNNLINLDENNTFHKLKNNETHEIIVDFSQNPYGELIQKINFNQSLSNIRANVSKQYNSNNIIFIFFDNLSRVHFYRQYKKTSKFIKNFLSYKGFSTKNNKNQYYHGFEFLKYHKFDGPTLNNAVPMFTGVNFNNKNKIINIVKDMKKLGYVTCNVQDVCQKELMVLAKKKKYYYYIEYDHEYIAPSCDPNIFKKGYGLFSGPNGIIRKCLYGKESIEYAFEYGKNFWKAYNNNKKFLRIVNSYGHEYIGEKSKYADDSLYNFLNDLYISEQMKNTTLFLVGDHGNLLMGVYELFKPNDFEIEKNFPICIIINPDVEKLSYYEQYSEIFQNQQTFITPFDIYFTLRNIIYGNKYKDNLLKEQINKGESLYRYINPKKRSCKNYIQMKNCLCK